MQGGTINIEHRGPVRATAGRGGWRSEHWIPGALRGCVATWRMRRDLRRCAALDPRFAQDVGLTEAEIATECAAHPWTMHPRVLVFRADKA